MTTFFTNIDSTGIMVSVNIDHVIGVAWSDKYVAFNTIKGTVKFNIEKSPEILEQAQRLIGIFEEKVPKDGEE